MSGPMGEWYDTPRGYDGPWHTPGENISPRDFADPVFYHQEADLLRRQMDDVRYWDDMRDVAGNAATAGTIEVSAGGESESVRSRWEYYWPIEPGQERPIHDPDDPWEQAGYRRTDASLAREVEAGPGELPPFNGYPIDDASEWERTYAGRGYIKDADGRMVTRTEYRAAFVQEIPPTNPPYDGYPIDPSDLHKLQLASRGYVMDAHGYMLTRQEYRAKYGLQKISSEIQPADGRTVDGRLINYAEGGQLARYRNSVRGREDAKRADEARERALDALGRKLQETHQRMLDRSEASRKADDSSEAMPVVVVQDGSMSLNGLRWVMDRIHRTTAYWNARWFA